ncbi:MAG: hypothetical protein ACJ74W_15655 [Pyrinomonadaceae bacterium]
MRELRTEDTSQRPTEPARADDATIARSSSTPAAPPTTAHTYTLFGVKRLWSIVAGLGLVGAVALGWRGYINATFVIATLGAVAWFLDQRNLLRARIIEPVDDAVVDEEEIEHDEA